MTGYVENFDLIPSQYPRKDIQTAENHRAMAALYELLENAVSAAENYVMYTDGRLQPLSERGTDLLKTAAEFKERYRHEAPCGWTEDKLMTHCDQRVTRAEIAALLSRPSLDVTGMISILNALSDTAVELPRGRFLLMRDNLTAMKPHQPADISRDLADVCGALYEIQHVDLMAHLREELSEMDAPRDKALQDVEEAIAAYSRAVAGGDVVAVEFAHRRLITARYELVAVYVRRLQRISGGDIEKEEGAFAKEMDALKDDAENAVRQFRDAIEEKQKAVRDDTGACERRRREEDAAHEEAGKKYREAESQMDDEINGIVVCKRRVIEELRQKARELRELMQRQREAVEAQMKAKRAEEERVTKYREFTEMQNQQKLRLLRCAEYCSRVESLAPNLKTYVDEMVKRLPRKSLREAIEKINDDESDALLTAYREFSRCCGELTVKKMHRLDTLERQARLIEHNRNSAMESLDPNMSHYRTELEEIIEQMKGVSGVINALNATQDSGEQLFQTAEERVREMCDRRSTVFVHPLQENGILSVEERTRFVNRSMLYVENEERKVLEKKNVLNRMRQAVEEEEAATESVLRSRPAVDI